MCKILLWIPVMLLSTAACKKSGSTKSTIGDDSGCISRLTTRPQDTLVAATDYSTAMGLFTANHINTTEIAVLSVRNGSVQNKADVVIETQQYVNGLPVFNNMLDFDFQQGTLNYSGGVVIGSCSLDTVSSLRITQVRKLYVEKLLAAQPESMFAGIRDSCLTAQFGYYNTNTNAANAADYLVKAWYVHPLHAEVPAAYIKDDGTVLLFFTGIVY